jgi:hypothetical protein
MFGLLTSNDSTAVLHFRRHLSIGNTAAGRRIAWPDRIGPAGQV